MGGVYLGNLAAAGVSCEADVLRRVKPYIQEILVQVRIMA